MPRVTRPHLGQKTVGEQKAEHAEVTRNQPAFVEVRVSQFQASMQQGSRLWVDGYASRGLVLANVLAKDGKTVLAEVLLNLHGDLIMRFKDGTEAIELTMTQNRMSEDLVEAASRALQGSKRVRRPEQAPTGRIEISNRLVTLHGQSDHRLIINEEAPKHQKLASIVDHSGKPLAHLEMRGTTGYSWERELIMVFADGSQSAVVVLSRRDKTTENLWALANSQPSTRRTYGTERSDFAPDIVYVLYCEGLTHTHEKAALASLLLLFTACQTVDERVDEAAPETELPYSTSYVEEGMVWDDGALWHVEDWERLQDENAPEDAWNWPVLTLDHGSLDGMNLEEYVLADLKLGDEASTLEEVEYFHYDPVWWSYAYEVVGEHEVLRLHLPEYSDVSQYYITNENFVVKLWIPFSGEEYSTRAEAVIQSLSFE